jgi:biopolymer transport protein ExbB/TolQ
VSLLLAILTVLLLLAVVLVLAAPLRASWRAHAGAHRGEPPAKRAMPAPAEFERDELEAAREAKYREIRDAELDYRTGKLSREDYEAIDRALRAEAIEILKRLEAPGA